MGLHINYLEKTENLNGNHLSGNKRNVSEIRIQIRIMIVPPFTQISLKVPIQVLKHLEFFVVTFRLQGNFRKWRNDFIR